jgi:glycosyltransferase involved in cell wall biosynthesis
MKLTSVITTLNPAHGGPVECANQLYKNMTALGHSYDVVCLDRPDAPWIKKLPFKPICLGSRKSRTPIFEPKLIRFLKEHQNRYDGTILHGIWTFPNIAMRLAWNGRHRYVVFSHGMLDPYFIHNFPIKHIKKSLYYRLIAAPLLSNALATLFTCEEERRLANTSYRPAIGRRIVVRYGINPPASDSSGYQGRLSPLKESLSGKNIILFLGRIHPKKGCDLLIEALSRVTHNHPHVHAVIAGPDETGSAAKLKQLAQLKGIADRVTWTGPVYGEERWFLYNLANVFILPSHMENFGMAVAESLSQGLPVLVSDKVNIYGSIVKAGAGFVAPDTVDGTVSLIDRWCKASPLERDTMRVQAHSLFEREFRAIYTAEDVIKVFQDGDAPLNQSLEPCQPQLDYA